MTSGTLLHPSLAQHASPGGVGMQRLHMQSCLRADNCPPGARLLAPGMSALIRCRLLGLWFCLARARPGDAPALAPSAKCMLSRELIREVLLRVNSARQLDVRCTQHSRMPFATFTWVVQLVAPRLPGRVNSHCRRALTSWTHMASTYTASQRFATRYMALALRYMANLCKAVYGVCHARA
jgi:hypothetical protein